MRSLELGLLLGVGWGAAIALGACGSGASHGAKIGGSGAAAGLGGNAGTSAGTAGNGAGGSGATSTGGQSDDAGSNSAAGEPSLAGTGGGGALPAGLGVGDDCTANQKCRAGLSCVDGACAPSGATGAGLTCVIEPECTSALQCVAGRCTPEGEANEGEECLLDSQCKAGLRCAFSGLAATCAPQGDVDVKRECETSADCYQGLACTDGSCGRQPPGIPVFPGVECEAPSTKNVTAYFEVPGADGANVGDFFRLPFPNDVRRSSKGLDLEGFPTPGPGVLGVDAVALYKKAIEDNDDGWGAYPTVFFRFSGPLDSTTVSNTSAGSPAAWVDVTPNASEPWASAGLYWFYSSGPNAYICDNWIGLRRPRGVPLTPGHTYAVYLTTQIKAGDGSDVAQPTNLVSLLAQKSPKDSALASEWVKYAPLRAYLDEKLISRGTILNATVFTVGGVRDTMAAVADAIDKMDPPKADHWTKCGDGAPSPCPDHAGLRACSSVAAADYDEYHALVTLPIFQSGTAPYLTPADGGDIVIDDPRAEQVCLSITVPSDDGAMPSAGWPLVVFAHGTGGSFRDHVTDSVAGALSKGSVKFAVLGIDQVEHGPRRGSSQESPDNLFFNFLNPKAARGNPIQGAADQLSLAAFAGTLDGDGGAPKIDATKLFFFGHSQGSTEGSLMLPYADAYKAALLSGNGASLMNALLTKSKPVDIKSLLPIALADLTATGDLGEYHPVLSLLQQWIDPGDPLNFARYVATEPLSGHAAKHLFQTYGTGDSYAPPITLASYARAGGLPLVKPVVDETGNAPLYIPLTQVESPLSGNLASGTITQGMREYDPKSDGHFVVFDVAKANADMVRFFSHAVSGVPAIGD